MKIVKAKEMARIEKLAYSEGASEEAFMLQAGLGVAELVQHVVARLHLKPKITLLCGSGNNAGDAFVAGKILLQGGFDVRAMSCASFEKSSSLCQIQSKRFQEEGGIIEYVNLVTPIDFEASQLLVDGLLGTGFHGQVEGILKAVIEKANASGLPIIAVDIPSGINGTTGEIGGTAISASDTLFLGLPKAGCFVGEAWNYVGKVHIYNFGLETRFIDEANETYLLIEDSLGAALLPKIVRNRHKYQAGYVVGFGGCPGMPGAPLMSSFAALRAGAGIVRLLHPEGMEADLAFSPPEVIRQSYGKGDIQKVLETTKKASAVFVGPGMGTSNEALDMLQALLPKLDKPCVIDAEALSLLAEHEIQLPAQTIMTPHQGEMKRLLHIQENLPFLEFLERARIFVNDKQVTLVLKGSPTFILHPEKTPYVCSRGDPGMATAGSGDVLTGIIAAILAQTHNPLHAALLGVQLHAIAGEHAALRHTSYSMTATDIIKALPSAFKELSGCRQ